MALQGLKDFIAKLEADAVSEDIVILTKIQAYATEELAKLEPAPAPAPETEPAPAADTAPVDPAAGEPAPSEPAPAA